MQISIYRSQNGVDGVENTPSAAILWAIYTDLHGFATRGALLESGQYHRIQSSPIWPWWAYCPARPYFAQYKFVFISILKAVQSFSEGCVLNQIYQHRNQHVINLCGTFLFASSFLYYLKSNFWKDLSLFKEEKLLLSPTWDFDFCNFSKLIKLGWACLHT